MPTITITGPMRRPGDCDNCEDAGPSLTQPPSYQPPGPGLCPPEVGEDPLPGNVPVTDERYRCALSPRLQALADRVRALPHRMGTRPYQVFLVWQERDRGMVWREAARLELTPVRIVDFDNASWRLTQQGAHMEGTIQLREVSPRQVDDDTLHGFLNGEQWGHDTSDREFFFEVVQHAWCEDGAGQQRRRRFTLAAEPFYDGERSHEWRITLIDQDVVRGRDGVDESLPDPNRPAVPRILP